MDDYRPHHPARARAGSPARFVHAVVVSAASAGLAMLAASCTASESAPIVLGNDLSDGAVPSFTEGADAGDAVAAADLIEYCPSDQCPSGRTTCPDSRFPCDVDLRTDLGNCGACGFACPYSNSGNERYDCVEGRCALSCNTAWGVLDCDGIPDNGCETEPSNDNCGACGLKCSDDPKKACVSRSLFGDIGCGCYHGLITCPYFPGSPFNKCVNDKFDDKNCGDCGHECDPTGGGAKTFPNTHYGCLEGECGNLKCDSNFGNCDIDLGNGCETFLIDRNNCGICGNKCPDGQECRLDPFDVPYCACPEGLTFCSAGCNGEICKGKCEDLANDPLNCGTCGNACVEGLAPLSTGECNFGSCDRRCAAGYADCNGNFDDDCEINTDSDPRNCGGCGNVCDGVAGQACVRGKCVVEPCDKADAGPVGAR